MKRFKIDRSIRRLVHLGGPTSLFLSNGPVEGSVLIAVKVPLAKVVIAALGALGVRSRASAKQLS